jgi:hypothetical protein
MLKKDFSLIHYQLIIVEFGGLVGVLWAKPKTMVGALFEGVVDANVR